MTLTCTTAFFYRECTVLDLQTNYIHRYSVVEDPTLDKNYNVGANKNSLPFEIPEGSKAVFKFQTIRGVYIICNIY